MRRFAFSLTLAVLLVAPLTARAQDDEPSERRVDAAARKLVDAARAMMISNRAAGLESLSCKVVIKVPQGTFSCRTEWSVKAGAKTTLDSLPEAMEPMRAMLEPQLQQQIKQLVVNRFCRDEFALADLCHLEMKDGSEDAVVLTGFEGEVLDRTFVIQFGESGLPKEVRQQAQGMDLVVKYRYAEKDGKNLVVGWDISSPMSTQTIDWTYEKKAGMWVATKIVTNAPMGGTTTIEITDFTVNGKSTDRLETPAEKDGGGGCGRDDGGKDEGGCGRDKGGEDEGGEKGGCGGCGRDG